MAQKANPIFSGVTSQLLSWATHEVFRILRSDVALEVYYQGGDDFLQSVKDSCHHSDSFSGDQEYSFSRFGRLLFRSI
jgi:hypothetical protein